MNENFLPEKKVDKSLLGRDFFIPADLQGIFSFYLRGDFKNMGGKFMIEIDVNIVEIVTNRLFINSLDIFREYFQNSCDAIDDAIEAGILQEGDGRIKILLYKNKDSSRITIEDNGMGISVRYFKRTMNKIGNSDKSLETDRGFRGIGRLCGLAYCKKLHLTSTAKGETKFSVMEIDAEKLRREFFRNKNRSAESILQDVITFKEGIAKADEHFFRVELIDIVETNEDLLNVEKVRDYLSFAAPVAFSPDFNFQNEIYKHAASIDFKITEYKIFVNGEPCFKNYKTKFNTFRNDTDKIFNLDFREFYDGEKLIAWSWVGLSTFKGVLSEKRDTPDYKMRGIRLRAGNIQIGDGGVFKNLFRENRYTKYFIGEVYAVDTNLIPNSRRDYFEENDACNALETTLEKYFEELHARCNNASKEREKSRKTQSNKGIGIIKINRLPKPNWSKECKKLYNKICKIIRANPKLSGEELIRKFEEVIK